MLKIPQVCHCLFQSLRISTTQIQRFLWRIDNIFSPESSTFHIEKFTMLHIALQIGPRLNDLRNSGLTEDHIQAFISGYLNPEPAIFQSAIFMNIDIALWIGVRSSILRNYSLIWMYEISFRMFYKMNVKYSNVDHLWLVISTMISISKIM